MLMVIADRSEQIRPRVTPEEFAALYQRMTSAGADEFESLWIEYRDLCRQEPEAVAAALELGLLPS